MQASMTRTAVQQARVVDAIEAAALKDLYAAAPDPLARALGLRVAEIAGATLLLAPGIPQPVFNRAIGLGVHASVTQPDLDALIAAFRAAGSGEYWIHHNPIAAPVALRSWLEGRGLTRPRRHSWAKMLYAGAALPRIDVFPSSCAQPNLESRQCSRS